MNPYEQDMLFYDPTIHFLPRFQIILSVPQYLNAGILTLSAISMFISM
jgi:hypothetical protein